MKKHYIAPMLEVLDTISDEQLLVGSIVGTDVYDDESGNPEETALSPLFGWNLDSYE